MDTDIQVKPDGSRILVMTRQIGGVATTTSIEISRPTKQMNDEAVSEEEGDTGKAREQADISLEQIDMLLKED